MENIKTYEPINNRKWIYAVKGMFVVLFLEVISILIHLPLVNLFFIRLANTFIKLPGSVSASWYFDLEQCNLFCLPTIKGYLITTVIIMAIGGGIGWLYGKSKKI